MTILKSLFKFYLFFLMFCPFGIQALTEDEHYEKILSMGYTQNPVYSEELNEYLNNSSMMLRHASSYALTQIGGEDIEHNFREDLKFGSVEKRRIAAICLGELGAQDESYELLIQALKDSSWKVRWASAFALGNIADQRALDDLDQLRHHDDHSKVRQGADQAIIKIKKGIRWYGDLNAALAKSMQNNFNLIVFVYLKKSKWSEKMLNSILIDPTIVSLSQKYVMTKISPYRFKGLELPEIRGVPTIYFMNSKGEVLDQISGFVYADSLIEKMEFYLNKDFIHDETYKWHTIDYLFENDNFEKAVSTLLELESIGAQDKDRIHFNLGYAYGKLGNHDEAIVHLEQVDVNLNDILLKKSQYCLALSYLAKGRVRDTKEILKDLLDDLQFKEQARLLLDKIKENERSGNVY